MQSELRTTSLRKLKAKFAIQLYFKCVVDPYNLLICVLFQSPTPFSNLSIHLLLYVFLYPKYQNSLLLDCISYKPSQRLCEMKQGLSKILSQVDTCKHTQQDLLQMYRYRLKSSSKISYIKFPHESSENTDIIYKNLIKLNSKSLSHPSPFSLFM